MSGRIYRYHVADGLGRVIIFPTVPRRFRIVKTTCPVRFNAYFSSREQPKIASDDRKTLFCGKSEMGFARFPVETLPNTLTPCGRLRREKNEKPDRNRYSFDNTYILEFRGHTRVPKRVRIIHVILHPRALILLLSLS